MTKRSVERAVPYVAILRFGSEHEEHLATFIYSDDLTHFVWIGPFHHGVKSRRFADPGELTQALKESLAHGDPTLVDIVCQPLRKAIVPVSKRIARAEGNGCAATRQIG